MTLSNNETPHQMSRTFIKNASNRNPKLSYLHTAKSTKRHTSDKKHGRNCMTTGFRRGCTGLLRSVSWFKNDVSGLPVGPIGQTVEKGGPETSVFNLRRVITQKTE